MLTIFSVETWGQWHVFSICIKSPVLRAADRPWLSLWRAPRRYLSQPQTLEQTVSMRPAPIPLAVLDPPLTLAPGRSWGGLCSYKDSSTKAYSSCLHQLLLKHGGGSFSRSLMGDVSISSNWTVLQYKMLLENQCSFVCSSSLPSLSPWPRHGAELQALQHLGSGWQQPCSQGSKSWSRLGMGVGKTIPLRKSGSSNRLAQFLCPSSRPWLATGLTHQQHALHTHPLSARHSLSLCADHWKSL